MALSKQPVRRNLLIQLADAMKAFEEGTITTEQSNLIRQAGEVRRDRSFGWVLVSPIGELSALLDMSIAETERKCKYAGMPISDDGILNEPVVEITRVTRPATEEWTGIGKHNYGISVSEFQRQKQRRKKER